MSAKQRACKPASRKHALGLVQLLAGPLHLLMPAFGAQGARLELLLEPDHFLLVLTPAVLTLLGPNCVLDWPSKAALVTASTVPTTYKT